MIVRALLALRYSLTVWLSLENVFEVLAKQP